MPRTLILKGEHDFTKPDGADLATGEVLVLDDIFDALVTNPQYLAKKAEDEISYIWDRLIRRFTGPILEGTNIIPDGGPTDVATIEEAVRQMVLVPRFIRRGFGVAVLDALTRGAKHSRNFKAFLPPPQTDPTETGFCFMTLKPPERHSTHTYDDYRTLRFTMLRTYALGLLYRYPHIGQIVGLASEPVSSLDGVRGSSEDMVLIKRYEMSDREIDGLKHDLKVLKMFEDGNYEETHAHHREYPEQS